MPSSRSWASAALQPKCVECGFSVALVAKSCDEFKGCEGVQCLAFLVRVGPLADPVV